MFVRIRALIRKELRQIRRDTRTLAVLVFLPMFLLGIFGYAVNFDVHHIKTAILDQDRSPESRQFLELLSAYDYFDPVLTIEKPSEIDYLIAREKIQAALVIPVNFSRKIRRNETVDIQFIVDGVNGNIGQTASAYFTQITESYSSRFQVIVAARYGLEMKKIINVQERLWFNPELKSTNFLVPGLIAFILMVTAVISTALSVVREKEQNTIEQIIVSPVKSYELMIGKAIPFMIIALIAGSLILLAGWVLFGISIKGDPLTLLAAAIIFLFGALGQGLLISTVANTQALAFTMAIMSSLIPTMLLSGFVFRISSMPIALQIISYFIPGRYFLVILRGVILKGTSFTVYAEQFLFLIGFAVFMLLVSSKKMAKNL